MSTFSRKILLAAALILGPFAAAAQTCSAPTATSASDCGEGMEWSEETGRCLPLIS